MAQLYRKSALDKISSPEQLDKTLKVTSPVSWLVLIGITLIVVVAVIWSFFGYIPVTVSGNGIISSPVSTNAIYSSDSGTIVAVLVHAGTELHLGDPILRYQTGNNDIRDLLSDQVGMVSEVLINNGDSITQGNEVVRVSPNTNGNQVAVCYIALGQKDKITRGDEAYVYIDAIDSQTYGHLYARVINIDSHASSAAGMGYVLGKDNALVNNLQQNGAVAAVTCEFYRDDESVSGYQWSSGDKAADQGVKNGASVNVKILTERVHPITKLFSKLKELWGD